MSQDSVDVETSNKICFKPDTTSPCVFSEFDCLPSRAPGADVSTSFSLARVRAMYFFTQMEKTCQNQTVKDVFHDSEKHLL